MPKTVTLSITPELEKELDLLMTSGKSSDANEAIRRAIHDAAMKVADRDTRLDAFVGIAAIDDPTMPPFDKNELWEGTDPDVDKVLLAKRRAAVERMRILYPDLHGLTYRRAEKAEMFRGMDE